MNMNSLIILGLLGLLAWTNKDRIAAEWKDAQETYWDIKAAQQAREDYEAHLQDDDFYEDEDPAELEHPGDDYDDDAHFTVMVKVPSPGYGLPPIILPQTFTKAQLDIVRELAKATDSTFAQALNVAIQDRLKLMHNG